MQILFVKLCVCSVAESSLFVTPWTVALQVPLSMGFLQARILEWVAISFFRKSSRPMDRICVSYVGMLVVYHCVIREAQGFYKGERN